MSYRIEYNMQQLKKIPIKKKKYFSKKTISILLIVLIIGVLALLDQVDGGILELFYPGEGIRAQAALEQMADGIQAGENIIDAFTQFCREIIEYA